MCSRELKFTVVFVTSLSDAYLMNTGGSYGCLETLTTISLFAEHEIHNIVTNNFNTVNEYCTIAIYMYMFAQKRTYMHGQIKSMWSAVGVLDQY
jgi:hypothetical protein